MSFPNPLQRAEPSPWRKWKYISAACAGLLALFVLLLPTLLSSKMGRNLIKMRLESTYRGQAWITDWTTSWFGPTRVHQFSLTDGQGRQIKFEELNSPIGLWQLLFGTFDLKDATISGLHVEYVIDHGDGTSTLDRLPQDAAMPSLIGHPEAEMPAPPQLPAISGQLHLKDATLILTRGQILQGEQFRTVYRSMKLSGINGSLDIGSLDRPWKCDLRGTIGSPGPSGGRFHLAGTFDLGEGGILDAAQGWADVRLRMEGVPNSVGADLAPLGWLFFPAMSAEDFAAMFGPTLRRVEAAFDLAQGKLRFRHLTCEGQLATGQSSWLTGRPVLDLTAKPMVLSLESPLRAEVQMSSGLAQRLAYVNPFLADAIEGTGRIALQLETLSVPLRGDPRKMNLRGRAKVHGVELASGQVDDNALPRELTTQWQAVVGHLALRPTLKIPEVQFKMEEGIVSCEPHAMTIDGLPVVLNGTAQVGGTLSMQAEIALSQEPGQAWKTSINGTIDQPTLQMPEEAPLAAAVEQHLSALRARKSERLLRYSESQVRGMLELFDRMGKREEMPAADKPREAGQ